MTKVILLVEDNASDEKLTVLAFKKSGVANEVVVVLTASREEEDVIRSCSLGANAYVRKPVDLAAFAEAAKTLGLFWLLLNEPAPAVRPQ